MFLMISLFIRLMIVAVVALAQLVYWMLRAVVLVLAAAIAAVSSAGTGRRHGGLTRHRQAGRARS
jgi:hypothetical protein